MRFFGTSLAPVVLLATHSVGAQAVVDTGYHYSLAYPNNRTILIVNAQFERLSLF
jgi:hypothetical protein